MRQRELEAIGERHLQIRTVKMHMAPRIPLIVSAIILISGGVASGGSAVAIGPALHNCQNPDVAPESRIEACSALIHSNLLPHPVLARLYNNRAVAYEAAQDFDRALQDYNKALELAPDFSEAQTNRARLMEQHPAATPN